jgi:hypothetical protein
LPAEIRRARPEKQIYLSLLVIRGAQGSPNASRRKCMKTKVTDILISGKTFAEKENPHENRKKKKNQNYDFESIGTCL